MCIIIFIFRNSTNQIVLYKEKAQSKLINNVRGCSNQTSHLMFTCSMICHSVFNLPPVFKWFKIGTLMQFYQSWLKHQPRHCFVYKLMQAVLRSKLISINKPARKSATEKKSLVTSSRVASMQNSKPDWNLLLLSVKCKISCVAISCCVSNPWIRKRVVCQVFLRLRVSWWLFWGCVLKSNVN